MTSDNDEVKVEEAPQEEAPRQEEQEPEQPATLGAPLPVGSEVSEGTEFSDEEINFIEAHGLTIAEVRAHLAAVGPKSLETAIGSLLGERAEASKLSSSEETAT